MDVREVYIFGDKYRIKTDQEQQIVEEIALFLNGRMKEIEKHANVLTTGKIAVMAAFNIAAEYIMLKKEIESGYKVVKEINDKID